MLPVFLQINGNRFIKIIKIAMSRQQRNILTGFILVLLPFEMNGFYNPFLAEYTWLYWICDITAWIVIPVVVFILLFRNGSITFKETGFSFQSGNEIYRILLFSIIMFPVLYYGYTLSQSLAEAVFQANYLKVNFSYEMEIPEEGIWGIIALVYFSATAGFVEEIYYRGIFRRLFGNNRNQKILYVLISSTVFSSTHWEGGIHNIIPAFVFGLIASVYYVKENNIVPLIVGHTAVDLLLFS